jgi:hypothetical protein
MFKFIALLFLISVSAIARPYGETDFPPEFDHPYPGRLIIERADVDTVQKRCSNSWDVQVARRNGDYTTPRACSWIFDDPLNKGHEACKMIVTAGPAEATSRHVELQNCNGRHDADRKAYGY